MRLGTLVDEGRARDARLDWTLSGDPDTPVAGLALDSRAVEAGDLFLCVPGDVTDGHVHAPSAIAAGASALLVERQVQDVVPEIKVARARPAMAHVAAAFHGDPSTELSVMGVTGTNGKTTTVHLLSAVLRHAGIPAGVIGTLTGVRTTPEAPHLQAQLREMVGAGLQAVAMEVSSHALVQDRVTGTRFAVAVFTNLSPDHLDFHRDLEDYFQAKRRLFRRELVDAAVVNADCPYGRRLAADVDDVAITTYSRDDVEIARADFSGSRFRWAEQWIELAMPGLFNIDNALGAAAALRVLGVDDAVIAAGLSAAEPVPGRFEVVPGPEGAPTVIVDYSHTPDGIEKVLGSVRAIRPDAPVTVVFGCGGDRDPSKRPLMAAAAERADHVIVTSDNPRNEAPAAIIADIVAGFGRSADVAIEPDRRSAIARAVAEIEADGVVVVAGKGSETTQTIGDQVLPFDDRLVAAEILEAES